MCVKEDNRSNLNWNRNWDAISIITSTCRVAIYYRDCTSIDWTYVARLLNKGGITYDYSSKKGSKILARICKDDIWNKRLKKRENEIKLVFPPFKLYL